MADSGASVANQLAGIGEERDRIRVSLSRELITLLSEQMYQSPAKAIEELVVNSFDADAAECRVVVPIVSAGTDVGRLPLISVYDNGVGMDDAGLADLWMVGASNKRSEVIQAMRKRRQIGKFGIGKLATYALANRITYLTSTGVGSILTVSLSFSDFKADPTGPDEPVLLPVRSIGQDDALRIDLVSEVLRASGLVPNTALDPTQSWTLVLLEELKQRAQSLQVGRLRWVLRTAMPLSDGFRLYLNSEEVASSKVELKAAVSFTVADLPQSRLDNLGAKTGYKWQVATRHAPPHLGADAGEQRALVSELFDEGIFGEIVVTERSLYGGKSDDLTRSHGFFIYVRGRLINEEDPLFDLYPQAFYVFNRFRANIDADDLDKDLTAPREGIGISERRSILSDVLLELFFEARSRYDRWMSEKTKPQDNKREEDRNYVDPRNVERPVADALLSDDDEDDGLGTEADESWFYLEIPDSAQKEDVISKLYKFETRDPYEYPVESFGRSGRLVRFVPGEHKFEINGDHDLVLAFADNRRAMDLLKDVVTAEALLEVYLREAGIHPHIVGEILERRDTLLRSLSKEQVSSVNAIATNLRDAMASERDLEIALVVAARALGFVAKHMSGATNPDGLARLRDYPAGERKITLEAKSSTSVPSLGAIDFAGLARHVKLQEAQGCLLVAPDYPGDSRAEYAAAAVTAKELKISCWTVEQLARVVEQVETRYITARQILDIVLSAFTPQDVSARIDVLLSDPAHPPGDLARAVMAALQSLEDYGPDDLVRSIDMVMVELRRAGVQAPSQEVRSTVAALAGASQGAMTMASDGRFLLNTSVEELARRVAPLTQTDASPRRASTFRSGEPKPDIT